MRTAPLLGRTELASNGSSRGLGAVALLTSADARSYARVADSNRGRRTSSARLPTTTYRTATAVSSARTSVGSANAAAAKPHLSHPSVAMLPTPRKKPSRHASQSGPRWPALHGVPLEFVGAASATPHAAHSHAHARSFIPTTATVLQRARYVARENPAPARASPCRPCGVGRPRPGTPTATRTCWTPDYPRRREPR